MGDSALIEIALGLLFVFVLFSVLVSAANEIIVGFFKSRSVSLWDGILVLFNGDQKLRTAFYAHPLIKSLEPPSSMGNMLATNRRKGPSYIPPRTFAIALLDLLKNPHGVLEALEQELLQTVGELRAGDGSGLARASAALAAFDAQLDKSTVVGKAVADDIGRLRKELTAAGASLPNLAIAVGDVLAVLPVHQRRDLEANLASVAPNLQGIIKALSASAAGIEQLRDGLETWFRQGMDSVSGWYKRWTQAAQFGIGLVLAASLNLDTLQIARALDANEQLRHAAAAQATAFASQASPGQSDVAQTATQSDPQARYTAVLAQLEASTLPLGWEGGSVDYFRQHTLWVVFGWLLTALAGSFGAPFWFDLLKRVANLRASEPNPDEKAA
jgi:hypothetical protein